MFAFIDETGNTGANIFDKDQPILWIGAMMTPHDFDLHYSNEVTRIVKAEGLEYLHSSPSINLTPWRAVVVGVNSPPPASFNAG
jgi:hypothetical protein